MRCSHKTRLSLLSKKVSFFWEGFLRRCVRMLPWDGVDKKGTGRGVTMLWSFGPRITISSLVPRSFDGYLHALLLLSKGGGAWVPDM